MANFLTKALANLDLVEFDAEEKKEKTSEVTNTTENQIQQNIPSAQLTGAETEKFQKYFDKLFDDANLPGPDYYEFFKTMDTLEKHIPDEKARISATFGSLSIQGLTKERLLNTAAEYKVIMEKDRENFEKALNDKLKTDIGQKVSDADNLEKKLAANAEMIQKIIKENTEIQLNIDKLKSDISEEEKKLNGNKSGYLTACAAVINKITTDIQKIQSTL